MKKQFIAAGILLLAVVAVVFVFMSNDSKASSFTVGDGKLVIKSSFGTTISTGEIVDLKLSDTMPVIGKRTNGLGIGSVYKGEFTLGDGSKARLYVDASKPPFITFMHGDTIFCINADTAENTLLLFEKLKNAD